MPEKLGFSRAQRALRPPVPTFKEVDTFLRASVLEEGGPYPPPPFIIFFSSTTGVTRMLFTHPNYFPDRTLLASLPREVLKEDGTEVIIGLCDLGSSRCLDPLDLAVEQFPKKRVMCNWRDCNKMDGKVESDTLQQCQRCGDARYCSTKCQVLNLRTSSLWYWKLIECSSW